MASSYLQVKGAGVSENRTDAELVRRAQGGDRAAFAALCARHYDYMFRIAWQWCGRREDAEDIAQDAAVKFARAIGDYRSDAALTTWLYRLVINTAKDHVKAKRRHQSEPLFEDGDYAGGAPSPEDRVMQGEALRAIHALPPELKETVLLVHGQGLSHRQAAAALDCAEGTVSWRLHEAKKRLAHLLEPRKGGHGHG